jgi:hypothetical protein
VLYRGGFFAQMPNYAELVWKNVEAGEGIGWRGLAIADLNVDGKKEIIAQDGSNVQTISLSTITQQECIKCVGTAVYIQHSSEFGRR